MNSTLKWTMLSLTLGGLAAGCSSTDNGGTTTTTGASATTTGASATTGGASATTGGGATTGGAATTGGGATTGGVATTGGGNTTGGSGTTGGTTGPFVTYQDAGSSCWVTPTYDANATNAQLINGCTAAQGVDLGVSTLPCWDGGVTASSNLPADFVNAGFTPGSGLVCPTN